MAFAIHFTGAVWPINKCLGVKDHLGSELESTSHKITCPSAAPDTNVFWSRIKYKAEMQCVGAFGPHIIMGTTNELVEPPEDIVILKM